MSVSQGILQRLRQVLVDENATYPLHEPSFSGNESKYVQDCLESGWVSSVGSYVNEFESKLTQLTDVNYAVATMNGTAALHACLIVAGVKAEDEVLLPSLTFVATANVIRYCHAIPHFVDTDEETLGVDAKKLSDYLEKIAVVKNNECYNKATGRRISALCVTHVLGHAADLDALSTVCERFHLCLIEDAAEALCSYYKERHVGNVSSLAALSFNGNKIVTTGGGGAVLTNDEAMAEKARHITTTARKKHQWNFVHDEVGYNYRMPNINAALGCAQLERVESYVSQKRRLNEMYAEAFSDFAELKLFREAKNNRSNYWLNAIILHEASEKQLEEILSDLNANKIISRPLWELMHRLPMYVDCPRMDLSVAESLSQRMVLLPSSPGIVNA